MHIVWGKQYNFANWDGLVNHEEKDDDKDVWEETTKNGLVEYLSLEKRDWPTPEM